MCRIQCITAEVINPESAAQRVYVLYINIYNEAVLFILSTFIMPSEGHFGIRYDMDFLPPPPLSPLSSHLLQFFFRVQIVFLYSRMGLLPLAVFNTAQACFLIIFSSLHWHWFMRVMLDTPPRPAPSTNPPSVSLSLSPSSSLQQSSSFLCHISDIFFLSLSDSLSFCLTVSISLLSLMT